MKPTIESLQAAEEAFCESAVKLRKLQNELGFVPNTSVHVASITPGYPDGDGIIAPYGNKWRDADHMHIPVIFTDGRLGLYSASRLTLTNQVRE